MKPSRPCLTAMAIHYAYAALWLCEGTVSCSCRSCRIKDGLDARRRILAGQEPRTRRRRYAEEATAAFLASSYH